MRDLNGKRVLITGGARGIGLEIARRFSRSGAHALLADLDPAALREGTNAIVGDGGKANGYQADITDVESVQALRNDIDREHGPIDVLVNNAGVVFGGPFLEVPLERHMTTYQVNVLGLVATTRVFLPDLIARPDAHLVNLASASGLISLPYAATYASSKAAVIGFSDSMRLELEELGHRHVHVTTVCPSFVSTGLFEGARPPRATRMLTAPRLADLVVGAVLRNRAFVMAPWLVKVTPALKGVLPTRWFDRVSGWFGASSSMRQWRGRAPDAS